MYENKRLGFLFVLPFVLGVLLFKLTPFVMSFALSFTQYDLIDPPQYVGLRNYEEMLVDDPLFVKSLGVTLWFAILAVPARVGFALFIAHVLNFKLRGINAYRAAFYIPSILGGSIATAVLWRFLFAKNGLVNILLQQLGLEPIAWLADEHYSIWTIVLLFMWQFGSAMVIFLAALQNVPQSLYEAAEIDGASKTQQFWRITVPLITPVIFFNMIMQMVHAFQEFNGPYLITEGGPLHSTYVLALYIYDQSFRFFNLGYGAALSWVLFALVGGLALLSFWSSKYWVFYAGEKDKEMSSADILMERPGEQPKTPWLRYLVLAATALVMLYPLIWLIGASFKSNSEIFSSAGFWPSRFDLDAYAKGWKTSTEYTFATYFLNSFLITIPRIIVTVISCVLVAYAFARFEFWGKKTLFSIMIGTMMLPLIVLRLPQYLVFREVGWLDSYLPLVIPSAFATDTFFVFMLVQFLRGIPRDMEEAAQIDGCNALQLLWHIIVPLLKPAIISVIVFQFIWTMNDFMGPLIYLASVEKYPVSLALKMSIGATEEVEWANVIAISVVALIPSVLVFFAAQKHFIEGAASSGVKG